MSIDELIELLETTKKHIGGEPTVFVEVTEGNVWDVQSVFIELDVADGSPYAVITFG